MLKHPSARPCASVSRVDEYSVVHEASYFEHISIEQCQLPLSRECQHYLIKLSKKYFKNI